ncbi:MAG: hypothetical protein GXO15_05710, partial [Crenarchaeota archaeon]|nr:hypothetical protein [Thermoproteota archaeon]
MADGDSAARLLLRRERLPLLEVVEPSPRAARLLGRQTLGELLHVVEALYLLYHDAAVVEEPGGRRVGFEELMAIYSELNP